MWAYFGCSLLVLAGIIAYVARERIRKEWYKVRFPEKLIHVVLIYPGNFKRDYWRLIPEDTTFELDGGTYNYDDDAVLKANTWFASKDKKREGRLILRIGEKEYYLDDRLKIKNRWETWPEIYFCYGCPFPVDWQTMETPEYTSKDAMGNDISKKVAFNAMDWERLKKSTILTQIYATLAANGTLIFIVILLVAVLILSGVSVANQAGIIHLAGNTTAAVVR
jgi:hypothetical protein